MVLSVFSQWYLAVKARRKASSMATCRYSQPVPRWLLWPARSHSTISIRLCGVVQAFSWAFIQGSGLAKAPGWRLLA